MLSNKQIDYAKFFRLKDPLANRPLRIETDGQNWVSSDIAWQLFKAEYLPPEPVQFRGYMGKQITDFLWSGLPPLACVSQGVLDLLATNQFRGWSTYPVTIYDRSGEQLLGYHGFAVKSWAGERDTTKSEVIVKPPIVPGAKPRTMYKGYYFDEKKWDGSDIFRVNGAFIIITENVMKAFKKVRISNVRLTPILEVETMCL